MSGERAGEKEYDYQHFDDSVYAYIWGENYGSNQWRDYRKVPFPNFKY